MIEKLIDKLFEKVDISTIVLFRIFFGVIMLIEIYRFFENEWISKYWIKPHYNFPFWPFLSLEPLPGNGMYFLFIALGILALFITVGLYYRQSILFFFLGFTYVFLLEQTRYLNHFYLVSLISFVLIFIPASNSFSLDVKWLKKPKKNTVSRWCLWLLRFMIGLPFFFGGIAKINSDWLAGQPLQIWLAGDTDFPIIGKYFTEMWMILFMSYSGLLLDLLIVPFLLIKRTRIWAFLAGLSFHLMNAELFTIGIFPWFMIAATTLFFGSNWPRILLYRLKGKMNKLPKIDQDIDFKIEAKHRIKFIALVLWALIMILVPLRHFIIPGNVSWTEDGHKFAWHMKLRTKRARGAFNVVARDGSFNQTVMVRNILPDWQLKKTLARPPIIWQFAHKLQEYYASQGQDVLVFANIEATLNGRPYQQFTNPNIEITSQPYPVWRADWILPLTTPLVVD